MPISNVVLYETPNANSTVHSLERLSSDILQSIFECLDTPELLILRKISRDFYHVAAACLYSRIIVTQPACKYIRNESKTWTSNKSTVTVRPIQLVKHVTKNKKLASFVKTLTIHKDGKGVWLPLLSLCHNLTGFHYRGYKFCDATVFPRLTSVTCHIDNTPVLGPNLTELRIVYNCDYLTKKRIVELADSMIDSGAYLNLRTLVFDHEKPDFYGGTFAWKDQNYINPRWIYFFRAFKRKGKRLTLEALALDGVIMKGAGEITKIVHGAVKIECLKTFELRLNEDNHLDKAHDHTRQYPGFLEYMTKNATSLEDLYLNYEIHCMSCCDRVIYRALRNNIPGQLKNLWLRLPPQEEYHGYHKVLSRTQPNLVKLRIQETNVLDPDYWDNLADLRQVLFLPKEQEKSELLRHTYTPWFSFTQNPKVQISEEANSVISAHLPSLVRILEKDIIYVDGREKLPPLAEYSVFGFSLVVQKDLLLLGDISVFLSAHRDTTRNEKTRKKHAKYQYFYS